MQLSKGETILQQSRFNFGVRLFYHEGLWVPWYCWRSREHNHRVSINPRFKFPSLPWFITTHKHFFSVPYLQYYHQIHNNTTNNIIKMERYRAYNSQLPKIYEKLQIDRSPHRSEDDCTKVNVYAVWDEAIDLAKTRYPYPPHSECYQKWKADTMLWNFYCKCSS